MPKTIVILKFHIEILKLLFLWPKNCLTKTQNVILNYVYFCINLCCAVPVVMAAFYQLSVGIDNFNIFIEALIATVDIFCYFVVYVFLLTNQEKIEKIFKDIDVFLNFCEKEVIEEIDNECIRYTKYLMIYVLIGVGFNLGWPLASIQHCSDSRESEFYLKHDPCGMVTRHFYPFDVSKPNIFWVLFAVETTYVFHLCCEFSLATATVVGLLMHIIAQFNHCGKKFEHIFDKNIKDADRQFLICVKYHQAILEYFQRVCDIFSNMLVVYVTMTSLTLALISYQISSPTSTIQDRIRYTILLIGWLLLFFLLSYYAQKLEYASTKIADSVYNSNWYDSKVDIKVKKKITLVIFRAQKPIALKVRYFGRISLVRFVLVLKTAYSFFTLLLTVSDEK